MKRTIYVKRSFERPGIEFTWDKHDAMDFVDKRLAAPTLVAAADLKPENRWDLIPVEQTGGTVYVVAGEMGGRSWAGRRRHCGLVASP